MNARTLAPLVLAPVVVAVLLALAWYAVTALVAALVAWPLLVPLAVVAAALAVRETTPGGPGRTHREGQ